jgi:hypothetical protein
LRENQSRKRILIIKPGAHEIMPMQEVELNAQEIWRLFKETDQKFKEIADQFKETAAQIKEATQSIKETAKQIKATDRKVDALTSKWGRFVEGLIVPAVKQLFQSRGIEVEKVYQRVRPIKKARRWKSTSWPLMRIMPF